MSCKHSCNDSYISHLPRAGEEVAARTIAEKQNRELQAQLQETQDDLESECEIKLEVDRQRRMRRRSSSPCRASWWAFTQQVSTPVVQYMHWDVIDLVVCSYKRPSARVMRTRVSWRIWLLLARGRTRSWKPSGSVWRSCKERTSGWVAARRSCRRRWVQPHWSIDGRFWILLCVSTAWWHDSDSGEPAWPYLSAGEEAEVWHCMLHVLYTTCKYTHTLYKYIISW